MCSMTAFKEHCAFNFLENGTDEGCKKLLPNRQKAMGSFGRITSLKDLPSDKVLLGYIKEAMQLNEEGIKSKKPSSSVKRELVIPDYVIDSLRKNKKAFSTFENFSSSNKREYVE